MVSPPAQRNLILILARDFASRLATAFFVVDAEGSVIYFNEAAERLLGQRFIEGPAMPASEWSTKFEASDADGNPVPLETMPLGVAIARKEPEHGTLYIRGLDGVHRRIEVTAFPLLAHSDECIGAIAIFWEPSEAG